jgi:hypothetical protein
MKDETTDQPILKSSQRLAAEEHRLFAHEARTDADHARLAEINVELDQCWDLSRQRQALRDAGRNPNKAHVRPPEIIATYENDRNFMKNHSEKERSILDRARPLVEQHSIEIQPYGMIAKLPIALA